jgi:hypothetical protein
MFREPKMKRNLFSKKVVEVMTCLYHELPESTYWCPDMMKMLVFMVDWTSQLRNGHPVTDLSWSGRKSVLLEALGLEKVSHWETYRRKTSSFQYSFKRLLGKVPLTPEEIQVIKDVARVKNQSDYRVGSIAFRQYVLSLLPEEIEERERVGRSQEMRAVDSSWEAIPISGAPFFLKT